MSQPDVHWDSKQGRYYRLNASYNFQAKKWESEWMPPGWSPEQQRPTTPQSNSDVPGRADYAYTASSPQSDSAYGSSPAGPAHLQFHDSSAWPLQQPSQSDQRQSQFQNFTSGSTSNALHERTTSWQVQNLHPSGGFNPNYGKGQGPVVVGQYNKTLPTSKENLPYEPIDASYCVRDRKFFYEGRVFAVILNETAGATVTSYNSAISEVRFIGNHVYTSSRRFVVVRQKREFCFACPIFTYSGRATTKKGVRPEEHGIAYSWGQQPRLVPGETGITKASIAVVMADKEPPLQIASRIYYGIHHPIQYNVRVKDIGYVAPLHTPTLIGNWKAGDTGEARQAPEETATAEDPDLPDLAEETEQATPQPVVPQTVQTDPHLYHPQNNPYGYHSKLSPLTYHPTHNPHGYHPQNNQYGYHPQSNPYCYHPENNPHGYHSQITPYCYHPLYNEQGYHSQHNPYGYHPQTNPNIYHKQANPHGYHTQFNRDGYHPQYNPFGWHPQYNVHGYHPKHNAKAYHPTYRPKGVRHNPSSASQQQSSAYQEPSSPSQQRPSAYPKPASPVQQRSSAYQQPSSPSQQWSSAYRQPHSVQQDSEGDDVDEEEEEAGGEGNDPGQDTEDFNNLSQDLQHTSLQ